MNNISVCIPTYKRPLMLRKLITSISKSNLNKSLINNVTIIIMDNDIDKTASKTVIELKEHLDDSIKMNYYYFPVKGLSNVRNELLKRSLELNPDFIAFIDDDEYASAQWLNELVETISVNKGDMAMGPIISVFDMKVSKHISCWIQRPVHPDNTKIKSIATNNLIIRTDTLRKYNIWFDDRFNYIGSEDSFFGIQMMKKGAAINWASNAIVYETIPEKRATLKWLIRRKYNNASSFTYILKLEKEYLKLLKKIVVSLIYIILGISTLIISLIPIKRKYWGIIKLTEGLGGIAALGNLLYQEYK